MNYRHGDTCYVSIEKLPKGLIPSKDGIILASGSGGHTHSYKGGQFYPKVDGDFIIGYFVAKNTKLYHPEHGEKEVGGLKECSIKDGIYEVRRQVEYTPEGLKQVID